MNQVPPYALWLGNAGTVADVSKIFEAGHAAPARRPVARPVVRGNGAPAFGAVKPAGPRKEQAPLGVEPFLLHKARPVGPPGTDHHLPAMPAPGPLARAGGPREAGGI